MLPLFDKSDDIIGGVVILMKLGMIENLLMVFLQRDLQMQSERKHTIHISREKFVYVRVTVGKSCVLERRLMTEWITDLGVLESTEVKFWIKTLH